MSDLVKRLRAEQVKRPCIFNSCGFDFVDEPLTTEAADHIEALEAVVEAARTFLNTSFDIDSLRCPMCRAQHKDGHNRWCWTRPLHEAFARLDAQKEKSDG